MKQKTTLKSPAKGARKTTTNATKVAPRPKAAAVSRSKARLTGSTEETRRVHLFTGIFFALACIFLGITIKTYAM